MLYTNLIELVKKEYAGYMENQAKYISENDNSLKNHSTDTRWKQFKDGKITKEKCVEYAIVRNNKRLEKDCNAKLEKLDKISQAENVESVSINVTWKRNATWGYNPTAEVVVHTTNHVYKATGTASGCGYDKESAAVGSALNSIYSALKMLCDTKEKSIVNGKVAYGQGNESNRNFIAYGAGYGAIPYFEGGVGMSSFQSVFSACGYVLKHQNHTKTTDYYYFTVKGE